MSVSPRQAWILLGLLLVAVLGLSLAGWAWALLSLGAVLAGTTAGWVFHQLWRNPRILREAQARWQEGASPAAVRTLLDRLILPLDEVAWQAHQLRSQLAMTEGHRNEAWYWALQADLQRTPWRLRPALSRWFEQVSEVPTQETLDEGLRLLSQLPQLGRLHQMVGLLRLRSNDPHHQAQAWDILRRALPLAQEDPLLLEDLMLTGMERLQAHRRASLRLGTQEKEPELPFLFLEPLHQLQGRFGLSRYAWDREAPAQFLLELRQPAAVLHLAETVEPGSRSPVLWECVAQAWMDLGVPEAARRTLVHALGVHPKDFHLLMLSHQSAMDRQQSAEALHFLEAARTALGPEDESLAWDWLVRRAEFAYWVEHQPESAWHLLQQVPADRRGGQHPPLELELLVALGRMEEAYPTLQALAAQHPEDADLALLQGECLAGMGAWEALEAYLEGLEEPVRGRADYWHLRGIAMGHLNRRLEARECLERAAFMAQHQLPHVLEAGHACMELGEWERAAHHWRQALRLDPTHEDALVELSETRRLAHDPEGAKRYLRECLLHHPESLRAQQYLAEIEAN